MKILELLERTMKVDVAPYLDMVRDHEDQILSSVNYKDLINHLNKIFANTNIRFVPDEESLSRHEPSQHQDLGINGGYISQDGNILVYTNSLLYPINDDHELEQRLKAIGVVLNHELIHARQSELSQGRAIDQYTSKKLKHLEKVPSNTAGDIHYKRYLADPHEQYARANDIVQELLNQRLTPEQIINALKQARSPIMSKSDTWATFYNNFSQADPLKILPRIRKLVYQILTSKSQK